MWPRTIAGTVASGPTTNCPSPQAKLAIAIPLVAGTGFTEVVTDGTSRLAGRAGRSLTT